MCRAAALATCLLFCLLSAVLARSLHAQEFQPPDALSAEGRVDVRAVSKLAAALAAAYANSEARKRFNAEPFSATASPAILRKNRWLWKATAGYGKGDLRVTVSFNDDGSDPKVDIENLVNEP
jgi:hypothetical protein